MLYREIIAVCSQIHTKHINILCGQKVEFVNVEGGVHKVSIRLQKVRPTFSVLRSPFICLQPIVKRNTILFGTQFHEMIECVDTDSTVDTTQSFDDCHITADTCNKHFTCMRGWVRIFGWVESTELQLQSRRGCARWHRDFAASSPYKTAYQQPTFLSSSHLCSPSILTLFLFILPLASLTHRKLSLMH
jgi:hypothetical protein